MALGLALLLLIGLVGIVALFAVGFLQNRPNKRPEGDR